MKILLCSVPDGALKDMAPFIPRGNGGRRPEFPLGILRILSSIQQHGYDGEIYDINNLRHSDEVLIKNFQKTKPTVVGLSGPLSHCYPHMKRITKILRDLFPDIWIIVGGNITGSCHILLNKTETDICVVGDGEIPFLKLLNYFNSHPTRAQLDHTGLNQIPGLAFIDKNNKLKLTGFAEQIPADQMQYPDFIKFEEGLEKFGGSRELIHEVFDDVNNLGDLFALKVERSHLNTEVLKIYEKLKNKKVGRIQTSKGCVAKCTFCQRATKGYRVFGPNHLEARIMELKERYNVGCLIVDDENFGSNRKQGYECARVMKKHDMYWSAEGARASSISHEDLKFYKAHNLLAIRYGIESGSQKILDIMEKKTTTEKVYENIASCKKLDIATASEVMMLGTPGETRETVIETAGFSARLRYLLGNDWNTFYPCWATAIPGTPLYEYSQQIGVIGKTLDEEENYLYRTADELEEHGILNYLNKTEWDIKEVHYWLYLYRYAGKKAYVKEIIKHNKTIKNILSEIYKQCVKEAFKGLVYDYNRRKVKKLKFLKKIKTLTIISIKFLTALSVPFLPRFALYPILKIMSDVNFYYLKKNHKVKSGRQKFNFFVDRRSETELENNLKFTQEKIAKTTRTIERSLRYVVKANSEKMKPPITDEEKSLQLLARQQ